MRTGADQHGARADGGLQGCQFILVARQHAGGLFQVQFARDHGPEGLQAAAAEIILGQDQVEQAEHRTRRALGAAPALGAVLRQARAEQGQLGAGGLGLL